MFRAFVLLTLLTVSMESAGHGDHSGESHALEHYARIAELTPEIYMEPSKAVPFVKISGEKIYLNGPFWELVQGWVRLYYRELQHECDHCLSIDENRFAEAARDQVAQSFLKIKVGDPLREGFEHIVVGTADIGSQLGKTAAVAKITAEVAETVVSKVVGGGGVHLICHLLDAVILFGTRHVQTAVRAFSWADRFDRSSIATWIRMGFVSSVVRRAQKKVRFEAGPLKIDEHSLHEIDEEGPNRWWGWVNEGKRAGWLRRMAATDHPLPLSKREFLGGRMKRYLWLKGRRRGHATFMKGHSEMDRALNGNVLWILSVQENLVQRAFKPVEGAAQSTPSLAESSTPALDEVRHGLAAEYAESPAQETLFDQLFREVDVVFQADLPSQVRYFQAARLEALLGGFIYGRFLEALNEQGESLGSSSAGIYRQAKLHWRAGRFGSYILEWSDFLRLAALDKNPERLLKYRYESMEALARVLRALRSSRDITSPNVDLTEFEDRMMQEFENLKTFTPWREKVTTYSWLPWRSPRPTCESLNEARL